MDVGDGRVEEDQVSIGGPLAAELRFGCVLPGPWGYDLLLGGSGEHGRLSPVAAAEGGSFKHPAAHPLSGKRPWQRKHDHFHFSRPASAGPSASASPSFV